MKYNHALFVLITLLVTACSIVPLLPKAMLTFRVIDDEGYPVPGIEVGVGFGRNTGSGTTTLGKSATTDLNGKCILKGNSLDLITYIVRKQGFYGVSGVYKFKDKIDGRWQPWNPELKVVLRKIENPVPMFAREFSKVLPMKDTDIGCDLTANDWVKPYGLGTHSDIIFHLKKNYTSDDHYNADLFVKFAGRDDGYIRYDLNMYDGSEFKLPRYAPIDGYQKQIERHLIKTSNKLLQDDRNDNTGYVFRVRSSGPSGLKNAMYGKIQGDIGLRARGDGTAGVDFTYYLNPDHTRNLEYDPKRNLFGELKGAERVGL